MKNLNYNGDKGRLCFGNLLRCSECHGKDIDRFVRRIELNLGMLLS